MTAIVVGLVFSCPAIRAAEPQRFSRQDSPRQWVTRFSRQYDNTAWTNKSSHWSRGYMWPTGNNGWQVRILAMQGLVLQGKASVGPLIKMLKTGRPGERTFAAQTLGYLAPDVPMVPLLAAARSDAEAAVRLYAVDTLGMRGGTDIDWKLLRKSEKNRDVLKHIGYAIGRKGQPLSPAVPRALKAWSSRTLNTAIVGKPAPDFRLVSVNGRAIRLSTYRGRSAVVLVFIFGDT